MGAPKRPHFNSIGYGNASWRREEKKVFIVLFYVLMFAHVKLKSFEHPIAIYRE